MMPFSTIVERTNGSDSHSDKNVGRVRRNARPIEKAFGDPVVARGVAFGIFSREICDTKTLSPARLAGSAKYAVAGRRPITRRAIPIFRPRPSRSPAPP